MIPCGGFASELVEVTEVGPTDEHVVDEAHDEITHGDAAPAFLDGAALESFENAESVREIGHELEAGKRGDLVL